MPAVPPTKYSVLKFRIKRAARRLLWPHPSVYYPIGLLRKRGNVFDHDAELYMGGYPRSGNSFSRIAFLTANPSVKVYSHQHIPSFVLRQVEYKIPGLILIRTPLDAAGSWAIHQNQTLEEAVAYWNDYYETLLPVRSELFLARFKDVTTNFGGVIQAFNERWGTSYVPFDHTPENAAQCFRLTEDDYRKSSNGKLCEMQVCRPSAERHLVKQAHLEHLEQSSFLRDELARASELYEKFVHPASVNGRQSSTRLIPAPTESREALTVGASRVS
jgi:hypothetical protein